jgi:hypothetical protein
LGRRILLLWKGRRRNRHDLKRGKERTSGVKNEEEVKVMKRVRRKRIRFTRFRLGSLHVHLSTAIIQPSP